MQFSNILVVCTGNICRSPMAAALLKRELGNGQRTVVSAGVEALIGAPADPLAIEVMQDNEIDITAHRAQQLTQPMLAEADLIFALDQGHARVITARYPQYYGKAFKLGHWNGNADVADPYRRPKQNFEQAFAEIVLHVAAWKKRLS